MKKKHKKHDYEEGYGVEYDENFAMIIGFTSGGAPYGLTWEEFEKIEAKDGMKEGEDILIEDDEELPF